MTQYKKYLENNYTKATVETYFKGINRSIIDEFKIYLMEERKVSIGYKKKNTLILE
ncbi:hypothetical protein [Psychrilyobacter atlanticus]|uniref:hypothetical protein n=1 Tax=Psychrilyobacter atlanticus TaxID=271091 RepID=UPI00040D49CC|nr:hypothetical protein [Psychrilyobacter atlanticus]